MLEVTPEIVSWFLKEDSELLAEQMDDIIKMMNVAKSWRKDRAWE